MLKEILVVDDSALIHQIYKVPLMNGLEFIQKVRSLGKYDNIPIIIVSTEDNEGDTQRGLALRAKRYVKKPFQPSDLHSLIGKLFGAAQV